MRLSLLAAALLVFQSASAQTAPADGGVRQRPENKLDNPKPLIDEMEMPSEQPLKQHDWLHQMVGKWKSESKITIPGAGEIVATGVSDNRMLGAFWLISEVESEMAGQKMLAVQQIGYDPEKEQFVGTWVDGTSSYIWRYTGQLSDDGKTLTLEAEGPNFITGEGTAKFRDAYTIESADKITAVSSIKTDDEWQEMVRAEVNRIK